MIILHPTHASHHGSEPLRRAPRPPENLVDAEYRLAMESTPYLGDRDLPTALHHMAHGWENETGVPVRLELEGVTTRTPADAVLLRVTHEALRNIALHSCAERAVLTLSYLPGRVRLAVLDDGRGFDPAVTTPGPGLRDLSERVWESGGSLSIESVPGHGCLLEANVPLATAGHLERNERPYPGR